MTKWVEPQFGLVVATFDVSASAFLSSVIAKGFGSQMALQMPAATWTSASLGFHVSATEDGTYSPLYDATNTLVQISGSAAARAYECPEEVGRWPFVKLWSQNGSGTNANQAADTTVNVVIS